jgi:EmrB/QacA subfamily drug resistance transporter
VTATAPAGRGLDRNTLVVAGVVVLGAIMSILDSTIVNVAIHDLSRDLDAPLSTVQWVTTGYLLALAIVIPLSGWFSERFGSKRVWLTSVALFGVGSAACGLAPSAGVLIACRLLQGLGGGMIMPVGQSVVAQTAGPQRIGRVMSVIGVPMLLGPVLGPVVGGLIVGGASWRWIFYVNIPIVVAALVLGVRLLPGSIGRADPGRLDWPGVVLLCPGMAAIVFGLSETESHDGLSAPIAYVPMIAGAVLVVLFALHGLRAARPLIEVRLFRSRHFAAAGATTFLLGAAMLGVMLVVPLYLQVARGQDALAAGLLMAPQGLGAALAMPFSGRLVDRIGGGPVALAGCAAMALATVPLAFVGAHTSPLLLHCILFARGLGLGFSLMPTMAAAYSRLGAGQVPRATSALNALQRIGGSIGTALLAVVLQRQERTTAQVATAFAHTFAWAAALTFLTVFPAAVLAWTEWGGRR